MSKFELLKLICEAVALGAVTVALFAHPSMRRFVSRRNNICVAVPVLLFFVCQAVAQFTTRNQYHYPQHREPFPFTRWAMFAGMTQSSPVCDVHDWRGVSPDGSWVVLNPAHLFVSPNAVILFTKTLSLANALNSSDPKELDFARRALDEFARGLRNRHNRLNPEAPVATVELWQRKIDLLGPNRTVPEAFNSDAAQLIYSFPRSDQ